MADFSEHQKQYLQGFMTGILQREEAPFAGVTANGTITASREASVRDLADRPPETVYGTPLEDLCREERLKLEENPFSIWDKMLENARKNAFPRGGDVFRYKAHGLFYVTPAQDAFMLRCRIPGCMLRSDQLKGLASLADNFGGGYADITTRGNIQVREIPARHATNVLTHLYDIGLTSRGAGADNLRNITASPTSGFDPREVYDVRPLAKAMHHYILNSPDLYGLPRKFNVSFDNGGSVSVASDTNDIGFLAVRVGNGHDVPPGTCFRVLLGGITGHKSFADDTGLLITPDQCIAVAAAMIRVFIENGDRTNRKRARLIYLLKKWGVERFLEETEKKLDFPLQKFPRESCEPRHAVARHSHIGIHPQSEPGYSYAGVVIPVGRMKTDQMRALAEIARSCGSGDIRLTVFQNLIIPDIPDKRLNELKDGILEAGFHYESTAVSGGLVACTGNAGCKYAMTDTKRHALNISEFLDERLDLGTPVNIHLTGCPHSCAQHYCGDIGLLGVKTKADGESVEAYNVALGGGMDHEQGLATDLLRAVPADELPDLLNRILTTYLDRRTGEESFIEFTRRHRPEELRQIFAA